MESLFLMITSEMTTSVSVPSPMHRRNVTPVISLPDLDWVLFPDDNLRNDLLSTLIISAGIERGEPTKSSEERARMIVVVDRSRHGFNH